MWCFKILWNRAKFIFESRDTLLFSINVPLVAKPKKTINFIACNYSSVSYVRKRCYVVSKNFIFALINRFQFLIMMHLFITINVKFKVNFKIRLKCYHSSHRTKLWETSIFLFLESLKLLITAKLGCRCVSYFNDNDFT